MQQCILSKSMVKNVCEYHAFLSMQVERSRMTLTLKTVTYCSAKALQQSVSI
jgi:hypothetical protein